MDRIVIYKPTKYQGQRYENYGSVSMLYCMGFQSEEEIKDVIERNELGEITEILSSSHLPKKKETMIPDGCAYVLRLDDQYRMIHSKDFNYLSYRTHLGKRFRKIDILSKNFPTITKTNIRTISLHCNYPLYMTNFVASPTSINPQDLVDQIYQFAIGHHSLTTQDVFISNGGNIKYLREIDEAYRERFPKAPIFYANFDTEYAEYFSVKMNPNNSTIVLNGLDPWYGTKLF